MSDWIRLDILHSKHNLAILMCGQAPFDSFDFYLDDYGADRKFRCATKFTWNVGTIDRSFFTVFAEGPAGSSSLAVRLTDGNTAKITEVPPSFQGAQTPATPSAAAAQWILANMPANLLNSLDPAIVAALNGQTQTQAPMAAQPAVYDLEFLDAADKRIHHHPGCSFEQVITLIFAHAPKEIDAPHVRCAYLDSRRADWIETLEDFLNANRESSKSRLQTYANMSPTFSRWYLANRGHLRTVIDGVAEQGFNLPDDAIADIQDAARSLQACTDAAGVIKSLRNVEGVPAPVINTGRIPATTLSEARKFLASLIRQAGAMTAEIEAVDQEIAQILGDTIEWLRKDAQARRLKEPEYA